MDEEFVTPLTPVDPAEVFVDVMKSKLKNIFSQIEFSQSQPSLYSTMTQSLVPKEKNIFQQILNSY